MIRYIQYRYYTLLQYLILLKHIIRHPKDTKFMISWFKQFRQDISNCNSCDESMNYLNSIKDKYRR